MSFVEINWKPSERHLRQFAGSLFFLTLLVGWVFGLMSTWNNAVLIGSLSIVLATVGLILPRSMRIPFLLVSIVTMPIGWVLSELAMASVFFGLFCPIGLVFRLIGRDELQRKIDKNKKSYWEQRKQNRPSKSYFRQF